MKRALMTILAMMVLGALCGFLGCSSETTMPESLTMALPTMELSKELVTPILATKKGAMTPGELHNTLVQEYYFQYGQFKVSPTNRELAERYALVCQPYADVCVDSLEDYLNFFDAAAIANDGRDVFGHFLWPVDDHTREYWQGLLSKVELCDSAERVREVTMAYGEQNGFPENHPYSDALNILLNSNDYWYNDYQYSNKRLKKSSLVIVGDTVGGLIGGIAGGIGGFIFGGGWGALIGGPTGGAIVGGITSVGLNEALPDDY